VDKQETLFNQVLNGSWENRYHISVEQRFDVGKLIARVVDESVIFSIEDPTAFKGRAFSNVKSAVPHIRMAVKEHSWTSPHHRWSNEAFVSLRLSFLKSGGHLELRIVADCNIALKDIVVF